MNHPTPTPTPHDINTNYPFWEVCKGLAEARLAEQTVRCFCLAAKHYDRWGLTLEELDYYEGANDFHWNTTIINGFFSEHNGTYRPTYLLINRLETCGFIEYESEKEKPKLKLFTVRVVYNNKDLRKSYFTILDVSADAATDAARERVAKFRQLRARRGQVTRVDVTEVTGPFEAGQILHEER